MLPGLMTSAFIYYTILLVLVHYNFNSKFQECEGFSFSLHLGPC